VKRPLGPTKTIPITLAIILAGAALPRAQHSSYISEQFQKAAASEPGLAWIVPPDTAIVGQKHEKIFLYSESARLLEAHYLGPLPTERIPTLQKDHAFLCDPLGEEFQAHTYKIQGAPVEEAQRAFYTTGRFEGAEILDGHFSPLPKNLRSNAVAALRPETPDPLHHSFRLTFKTTPVSYSFHGLYHPGSEEMFLFATLLHDAEGEVLGSQTWTVGPDDPICADCGTPTYDDSLKGLFAVRKVFSLPGFRYPVLLRDTGTIEGRAISLVTFDESGEYQEQREYEYVVNCILGYDD
jgi:hypothetical protein